MNRRIAAISLAVVLALPAVALAVPATTASIKELMAVMHTRQLLESEMGQMDALMRRSMNQRLAGTKVTPEQRQILDDMTGQMAAVFKQNMKWEDLEPDFLSIYRKSFTQEEVNGMLKFYRSKAGQAVVKKMPLVMHNSILMIQTKLRGLMPQIMQIQQQTMAKLKAASVKN